MNHLRYHVLTAASLFLCAACPAFSQGATAKAQPKPAPAPVAAPAPAPPTAANPADPFAGEPEKRFDISLSNTTAEEAVGILGDKVGYPINVIFAGKSGGLTRLPDLQLRNVTLSEFFAAVKAAGIVEQREGRPGSEFASISGAPNIYTFSVTSPPARFGYGQSLATTPGEALANRVAAGGALAASPPPPAAAASGATAGTPPPLATPAEALRGALAPPPPAARMYGGLYAQPAPEKSTLFFDLSKILDDKLTIEDITTAIRTGWTAAADGKEPGPDALKFHQESKLLIATGPPAHLEAVTSIVRLLENRRLPSKDEQERAIEGMRNRIEESAQQNHRLETKLDEMEKLKEVTVRDLRDQITKLELELAKRARSQ